MGQLAAPVAEELEASARLEEWPALLASRPARLMPLAALGPVARTVAGAVVGKHYWRDEPAAQGEAPERLMYRAG